MWKFLRYALVIIVIAIAGILAFAATKPDTFQVSRSITIKAPPEKIFPLIDAPRGFNTWNPFLKLDPASKLTYRGPERGVGAAYDWDGDKNVGKGSMENIVVQPSSKVEMKLDFQTPFEAHNRATFTLAPQGDSTVVTWLMAGPSPFVSKVMTTIFNMDKMVGGAFEKGLADLKVLAEK